MCASGEIVHLWQRGIAENERCGCGLEFAACDFWQQVGKQAFGGWNKVDTDRIARLRDAVDRTRQIPRLALRSLPAQLRADLDEYSGYYLRLYRAIAAVSGCTALVDSSKHASLAFCLSRREDIDLRVIHMVRDSRAVAYSWTTKVARPEAGASGPGSYMTTYPPSRAAGHWNAQNGAPAAARQARDAGAAGAVRGPGQRPGADAAAGSDLRRRASRRPGSAVPARRRRRAVRRADQVSHGVRQPDAVHQRARSPSGATTAGARRCLTGSDARSPP